MNYCFAVIDLGSNSVRMSINAVSDGGEWRVLKKMRETVRLSEGMSRDNFLKENSMCRVIEALGRFCETAREYKCLLVAAIATAAVRNAANREMFLARVKKATGITFEVISGEQEAYYSYLAVRETIGIKDGLIFDTGGGSTEISLVLGGELKNSVSLPLGAVVLTERTLHSTQMQLYRYTASHIGAISWLDKCEGLPVFGIGGSARTMASLYKRRTLAPSESDGLKIPYASVAKIYQKIFNTAPSDRQNIAGMDISRADVILAGLTPAKVIMDMTGSPHAVICAGGVKEGVFFRMKNEVINKIKNGENNAL